MIPRAISTIFSTFAARQDSTFTVHISYLEIYNEGGFDLLDPSHETKSLEDLPRVSMMEDEDGNCHLRNLSMHSAASEQDALNLLFLGDTNRAIAETPMNLASSRSHCIFTIFVEGRKVGADTVTRAKLHLVDLAGSERVHKTNAVGQTLREATFINSSLFYLEMVIVALHEKSTKNRTHIPYRNSMMTSVLRDSLGGNCKTIMVATASAEMEQTEETISTCKFAQRVSMIKNTATVNEDLDPTVMIGRLKGEVKGLHEEIKFLKGEAGEGDTLTEEEINELKRQVDAYVNNRDPYSTLQLGKMTLTKLKDAFGIFKNLVLQARAEARAVADGADGTSGGDSGSAGEAKLSDDGTASGDEVKALRAKLQQRDQEIAILVNMVKQAKTGGAVDLAPAAAEAKASHLHARGEGFEKDPPGASPAHPGWVAADSKEEQGRRQPARAGAVLPDLSAESKAEANSRRLAARAVHGVTVSTDLAVLEDAQAAFTHFRQQSSRSQAIEDNKRVLREKFERAKQLAEQVNTTRSTINYLKTTIEQIRRERAMEGLRGDEHSAGSAQCAGDGGNPEEPTESEAEEQRLMDGMEREKGLYKRSFQELRELKAAIEHIQKLLEKSRHKLQEDFDEWYAACLNTEARLGPRSGDSQHGILNRPASPANTAATVRGLDRSPEPPRASPPGDLGKAGSGSSRTSAQGDQQAWQPGHRPPPSKGVALIGNKHADEDIMAFNRAREEFLRRQQQDNAPH